jgi:probable HAF family extracellular repeat protein
MLFRVGAAAAASYTISECHEGIWLYLNLGGLYNVGGYRIAYMLDDNGFYTRLDHNGTLTDIGTLGGSVSQLNNVNDKGQVVGTSYVAGDVATHAFIWDSGSMIDLGTLGGTNSEARSINNNGQVAGNSYISGDQFQHAFLFKNGGMSDLGTLGGNSSSVAGMNENGQIIGKSTLAGDEHSHAFLWTNGSMTDLTPLFSDSEAKDINSCGQIVGNIFGLAIPESKNTHPFLYSNGTMTDINALVDEPHGSFYDVLSIDDSGKIVVYGEIMSDWGLYRSYTYVLMPVPEPSPAVLATGSVICFLLFTRRKGKISW